MFSGGDSTPRWTYSTGGPIPRSPVLGGDGLVRVHSTDGFLHLVRPDGSRAAEPAIVGPPLGWATPMVDDQHRTWVALADGGLTYVDAAGKPAKRSFYRTRRRFDCTGVILNDVLYVGSEDHFVHAIPLTAERGDNSWRGSSSAGRTGGAISSPLVVTLKQELLVISQDDQLHAFGRDGSSLWKFPLPGQVLGAPVVTPDGTILLGISQTPRDQPGRGLLLALDGGTRRTRWQLATEGPIEGTPALGGDGTLYCGDNAGEVYAVGRDGNLLWRAQVGSPVRSMGCVVGSLILFGTEEGSLVALRREG
jgi:outer membrane protein assembly factor BamB